jgi:hypothetical protein
VPQFVFMGHWTRTVHEPTPVGVMFHQTGLNHAGYQIQLELTPYCNHDLSDEMCWKANMWDGRDFTLTAPVLMQMLDAFFPPSPTAEVDLGSTANATAPAGIAAPPPPLCSDMQDRSNGTFVLYNVNCADEEGGPPFLHHYYWPCTVRC